MMKTITLMTNTTGHEKRYYQLMQQNVHIYSWLWQLLLISGPPGLGKTTLAHVVAKQAGYEVMEINARYDSSMEHLI